MERIYFLALSVPFLTQFFLLFMSVDAFTALRGFQKENNERTSRVPGQESWEKGGEQKEEGGGRRTGHREAAGSPTVAIHASVPQDCSATLFSNMKVLRRRLWRETFLVSEVLRTLAVCMRALQIDS